ncbi:hypothetical protein [Actinoplanes sp. NPDC049599]|uniref:hypothetical protein n=1 Tax=Actinoplanes sp. NPDC049599 TaxID=3363903 RepID=UPI003795BB53
MSTWTATAGTHQFTVADEQSATVAADALSAYGFALVSANPSRSAPGTSAPTACRAWSDAPAAIVP